MKRGENLHKSLRHRIAAGILFVLFLGVFSYGFLYIFETVNHDVYRIVIAFLSLILLSNVLTFFLKQVSSRATQVRSQYLIVALLYLITIWMLVSPYLIEIRAYDVSPAIRNSIILFAWLMLGKYFFYMILSPWYDYLYALRNRKLESEYPEYHPKVSVIVPAWNEQAGIIATIQSVVQSTYKNLEVVVVNDGSTDRTRPLVEGFIRNFTLTHGENASTTVRLINQENGGKGAALNTGISQATGEIIITIDGDCFVEKHAVAQFVKNFRDPELMAAVGNVKVANHHSTLGVIQFLEYLFSFYLKKTDSLLGAVYIIGGAAGAFRKQVFYRIGGYSTSNITEDIELTVRIQAAGMKIKYVPDAIVYTEGASSFKGLLRQRLRWKRGRFQTLHEHAYMFFTRKKHHNKLLGWFVLPLAMLQEFQLLLEIPFLLFLYVYSFLTNDFSSFLAGIVVVGSMFVVQTFFDNDPRSRTPRFFLLIPIGWLLFYLLTFVEVNALIKSLWGFLRGKDLKWQKWERKGIGEFVG